MIYLLELHLHSSMVRLEIYNITKIVIFFSEFTFQYGQIRNEEAKKLKAEGKTYLHSSMVRLEIKMPYFSIAFTLDLHSSMVRLEINLC